ncbi:MAG: hypothetical protein M3P96_08440, partial [Actinomycetota bacterium]|nr:hypothetical protein [Actinomycetota bacterium]
MLAELAPGPELLAALLAVEPADRDPASRIDAIAGWERLAAWGGRAAGRRARGVRPRPSRPRPRGEPGFHEEQGPVAEFA